MNASAGNLLGPTVLAADQSNQFQDFPPYDTIWEKVFAVYKRHKDNFQLEQWKNVYAELTVLHEDGLNIRKDPKSLVHLHSTHSLEYKESAFEFDFIQPLRRQASVSTTPLLEMEEKLFTALLISNNLCVPEAVVKEKLLNASSLHPQARATPTLRDEEILELKLDAFGDFSSILNAAKKIVKGKIGEDELVEILTDCIALSQTPDGAMFFGDKDAKNFTRDVVASMKRLLKRHIRKHRLGQVKENDAEGKALLNLVEKTIYLAIRTGYHATVKTRNLIHLFSKLVWSKVKNPQFDVMFTKNFPFLLYKLVIWDNLDDHSHIFTSKTLSTLYRQFKRCLYAVVMLAKKPLYQCLEVIAMILRRNQIVGAHHDELNFIQRLCIKMLVAGMHSEPMDQNSFAFSMLEFHRNSCTSNENPFTVGPISLALQFDIGEFLCLSQPQEILEHLWHGQLHEVLVARITAPQLTMAELWNSQCLFVNRLNMTSHRKCPCLIAFMDFLVWVAFLSCTYATILAQSSMQNGYSAEFTAYHYTLFVITAGFLLNELKQIYRSGLRDHFSSLWNIQDTVIIITVAAFAICKGNVNIPNTYAYQALTIVSLFVLFRTLYFAMVFKSYGLLVTALFIMMTDTIRFLFLYLIIMAGFAVVMYAIVPDSSNFNTFFTSFIYLFEAAMQQFDFGWLEGCANRTTGIILLAVYVVISSVVLINMLIAILAETYSEMSELSKEKSAVSRANFIQEYQGHDDLPIPLNCVKFLFSLVGFLLKGWAKACWEAVSGLIFGFFDYVVTVCCIAPGACILDCLFIVRVVLSSASKSIHTQLNNLHDKQKSTPLTCESDFSTKFLCVMVFFSVFFYYTAYLITFMTFFVVVYIAKLSYNLLPLHSPKSGKSEENTWEDELSYRPDEQNAEQQSSLYLLKESMLKYFHEQADGAEDLIHEIDFKMSNVMRSITDEGTKNFERLHGLETRLVDKLTNDIQTLGKRLSGIEQANAIILAHLEEESSSMHAGSVASSEDSSQHTMYHCLDMELWASEKEHYQEHK